MAKAQEGKYASEAQTAQRPNCVLQSMLNLLRADKDFSDSKAVSAEAGFTVVQHEVDAKLGKVHRSGGRDFYRAASA
jgi:hypothetical protein